MISARSRGLPAVAVPGDDAWDSEWARLFAGRHVSVVLDCDRAGREAAARITADLRAAGVRGGIVDLARARTDGYDLTEWLAERPNLGVQELRRALGAPGARARAGVPAAPLRSRGVSIGTRPWSVISVWRVDPLRVLPAPPGGSRCGS